MMVQFKIHYHSRRRSSAWLVGAADRRGAGLFRGVLHASRRFIVTLAGMLVFKGLSLALLAGQSVGPFPPEFQMLSSGFIPDCASAAETLATRHLAAARRRGAADR